MKYKYGLSILISWTFSNIYAQNSLPALNLNKLPAVIGFGSCSHQDKPQPVLNAVVNKHPDLFIYLGDNIYGNSIHKDTLKAKYNRLFIKHEFQNLSKNIPLIATWDDHDYGNDDVGKHYIRKRASRELFFTFWNEPADSPRRKHQGIYTSYLFSEKGKTLQIILLDTRTFRDNLAKFHGKVTAEFPYNRDYTPHKSDSKQSILGQEQWQWLKNELDKPADMRIICSSTQFGTSYNGYETWANFPAEQKRMTELIRNTDANGVFFISGDVHYAEFSCLKSKACYPLYDFTSSGITQTWDFATPNTNRIKGSFMGNNFGLLRIDWTRNPIEVTAEILDVNGVAQFVHILNMQELKGALK